MKIVSPETMRQLDQQTMDAGTPGRVLMQKAGRGLASAILEWIDQAKLSSPQVSFVAGKGNNGGDAFVAAHALSGQGVCVDVILAASRSDVQGDAAEALGIMENAGIIATERPEEHQWADQNVRPLNATIVVDALLGTGGSGHPTGVVAEAIRHINALRDRAWVIAVDIPSGLQADTGEVLTPCVRADATVTMGLPKRGLFSTAALEVRGSLQSVELGFSESSIAAVEADEDVAWNAPSELASILPARSRVSHKGTYGRVLVIGGSPGMPGAPALCALGALRSGAGLVTVLTPREIASQVSAQAPELMVVEGPSSQSGGLSADAWVEWHSRINDFDVVVVGPGMGRDDDVLLFVRQLLRESTVPLILDADALNCLEGQPHWLDRARVPVAVTPHPGEMARLFGQTVEQIQSDRTGLATAAAKFSGVTVVLKGADTVIAQPDGKVLINTTGNPGMATAGTGDVLAGMLGGLFAQGLPLLDAARLAVYLHGKAGDVAAMKQTQMGMIATSLLDEVPSAVRTLSMR